MLASRRSALLAAMVAGGVVLQPSRTHAQWWSRAPADFEECADAAEKAATQEARVSALSECNAKFAGRRKPGGGYTYFDFMQNRSFDIAGPNPTPEEQKKIDEQYTVYLEQERRESIAAAFMAKQQQLQQASLSQAPLRQTSPGQPSPGQPSPGQPPLKQTSLNRTSLKQTSLNQTSLKNEKTPLPRANPGKPRAIAHETRPRTKPANCTQHSFACDWPQLSEGIENFKKALFGPPPNPSSKAKHG